MRGLIAAWAGQVERKSGRIVSSLSDRKEGPKVAQRTENVIRIPSKSLVILMSIVQRLEDMEKQLQSLRSEFDDIRLITQSISSFNSDVYDSIIAGNEFSKSLKTTTDILVSNSKSHAHDLAFVTLFLYWIVHLMESVDKIIPAGSVEIALNSVEETMDPKAATFYDLFKNVRG